VDPSPRRNKWPRFGEPVRVDAAVALVVRRVRAMLSVVVGDEPPLELQLVGRTVLHAIVVGLTVGAVGCAFLVALEHVEGFLLGDLGHYARPHAVGEGGRHAGAGEARLWVIAILPMIGALAAGWLSRWAPEIAGGGGDAMIRGFHHHGGAVPRRVALLKPLASIATLGTGGAGGREGPTMLLGGGLGAWLARLLPTTERERRVLMIAGVAAGISAVFRTPLGAALLAIEVLYRDDFEAEALIPAVLASVMAYALSATLLSTSPMFGSLPRFPFHWEQLPLFAIAAVLVAAVAAGFVATLRAVQRVARRLPGPAWARPAFGGAALGLLAVVVLVVVPRWLDVPLEQVAVLGGGYGSAQLAITGIDELGATAAAVLVLIAALRIVGAGLTIGTGGSAGDFAPSLAIGALVGGAIGHVARTWLGLDGVSPGAFALVGMATFYGGIAKVPLAATVMVCEMAGSYDLLVPLMLSQAIAFVALRRVSLYGAQVASQRHSPVHAPAWARHELARVTATELLAAARPPVVLPPTAPADDVLRAMADAPAQMVFPVADRDGRLVGLIAGAAIRELAADPHARWTIAADLMGAPVAQPPTASLAELARAMLAHDLRAIPIVDGDGRVLGLVDEHDVSRAYLGASDEADRAALDPPP